LVNERLEALQCLNNVTIEAIAPLAYRNPSGGKRTLTGDR
jgi:hypothetical protein